MKIKHLSGVQPGRPPQHGPKDPGCESEAASGYNFVRVGRFSVLTSLRAMALASPPWGRCRPFIFLSCMTLTCV